MAGVRRVLGYKLSQNWAEVYGKSDFSGELVLDIGADRGSTAEFFLNNGARSVVCSEPANSVYYRELRGLADRDDRICVVRPVLSPKRAEGLLMAWKPDTLKLDCEGCEEHFVDAIAEHRPPCVLAEAHSLEVFMTLSEKMKDAGYTLDILSERSSEHSDFTVFRADSTRGREH